MTTFKDITASKNVGVWGWWQGKNLGDMWILECLKKKFPGIIPLTTDKEDFSNIDFLIIGGGGLLNGPTLRKPFNKKPFCIVNGIKYGSFGLGGEFEIKDKDILKKFINFSVFFGVRDERNLMTYNINGNRRLELSGDCTFLYPLKRQYNPSLEIKTIKLIWRDPYGLMRRKGEEGEILNKQFGEHLGSIPFKDNLKCVELYRKKLSEHGKLIFDNYRTEDFSFEQIYKKFANVDLIVSMRYHGIVAAIQLGIPCIALDIYPKVRTIMIDCGLEKYCIKLSEHKKIHDLIIDIKENRRRILEKMKNYTDKYKKLTNEFANRAKSKIMYLMKRQK